MRGSGRILCGAAKVIAAVSSGGTVLDEELERTDPLFRRSVSHLVLNFFRRRKKIDALLDGCIERPPRPEIAALLRAAVTQLFFQSAIAPQSAVNVAVSEAKKLGKEKFVNAVLRRILREGASFPDDPEQVLPEPILKRWRGRPELPCLCDAFLRGAAFTFRLERNWELEDVTAEPLASPAFRFYKGVPGEVLAGVSFLKHHIYVQDPAASLPFQELAFPGAHRALDLCAAPGGKTLMMAELLPEGAFITAADRSANRQKITRRNLEDRGIEAEIVTALPEELCGEYDVVLADVPCSNTGVFRRRPDVLWNFSETKMAELVKMQAAILREGARLTAPGGLLIYSTCSIEEEENAGQVASFLGSHPEFSPVSVRRLLPGPEHDGAFAAVMKKAGGKVACAI